MRVLIVDDEPPARTRLRGLLAAIPEHEICGEAGDGIEAVRMAEREAPDVVLMDVRMPAMDGLEAARHLAAMVPPPAVIFVTAYSDHAIAAFGAGAVGYLLKPVRAERLLAALAGARRMTRAQIAGAAAGSGPRTHICARVRGDLELVPVAGVVAFRAEQKYTVVRHRDGELLIEEPLKELEEEFVERFVRVHRNALVARDAVTALRRQPGGGTAVVLADGSTVDVSRRHAAAARQLLVAPKG